MLAKSKELGEQIKELLKELEELPDGKLVISRSGSSVKWYQSDGHKKKYIPKKDRALAEQLAAKKYITFLLEDLTHEKNAIDLYLRHHSAYNKNKAQTLLTEPSGYQELLTSYFTFSSSH